MARKATLLVLLVLFALSSVFSGNMALYDDFDDEYIWVEKLTRLLGVIGPSTATPITQIELKLALDRVDRTLLPSRYKSEYDRLMKKFSDSPDEFSMDGNLYFVPQIYLSVDQETMNAEDYFIPFERRLPFAYGEMEFSFGNNFFAESSLEAINNSVIKGKNGFPYTSFDFMFSNRADGGWSGFSNEFPILVFG